MHASGHGAPRDLVAAWVWLQHADQGGASAARKYLERTAGSMDPQQRGQVERLRLELTQ